MADNCAREMDDVVRRLLPPEILADIGITVDASPPSAARRRGHAVVEELAAHLVGILGLAGVREQRAPPPASAAPPYCNHPQAHRAKGRCGGMDGNCRVVVAGGNGGGGGGHEGMARYAYAAPGSRNNAAVFDAGAVRRLPRFEPAAPCAGKSYPLPPARRQGSAGTGVFLPRAEVYLNVASKSPGGENMKPPRLLRKEAAVMARRQQQQLQAMAAGMEQKKAFAAALLGRRPALALPQEWTY